MSEEARNENAAQAQDSAAQEDKREKARREVQEMIEKATRGVIELHTPMMSRNAPVTQLHYDFSVLTNSDVIACLDSDRASQNAVGLSAKQAMNLYGRMHRKVEQPISGLDATDIAEQVGFIDTIAMVRAAQSFFALCSSAALMSIS